MSLGKAIGYLRTLGLTNTDALVYIFLAKKGPHSEDKIAYTLNLTTEKCHLSLRALVAKGIIRHVREDLCRYSAVPFEEIVDKNLKAAYKKLSALLASKAALLDTFLSTCGPDE